MRSAAAPRFSFFLSTSCLCLALLWGCGGNGVEAPDVEAPSPMVVTGPCGVAPSPPYNIPDYPCPPGTIDGWVDIGAEQGSNFRGHAWHLFVGINRTVTVGDSETLLWRTWKTSTDLFPGQYGAGGPEGSAALAALPGGRLENPGADTPGRTNAELELDPGVKRSGLSLPNAPKYKVPTLNNFQDTYSSCLHTVDGQRVVEDGKNFQSNGDVMVAGVIYDPEYAAASITRGGFWNAEKLDGLLPETQKTTPTSIWMDDNSIVLKPMLWPVPGGQDEFVAMPVWDANEQMALVVKRDEVETTDGRTCETYSGLERQAVWTEAVALTAGGAASSSAGARTVSAAYLKDGSVTYNKTESGNFEWQDCTGPDTSTDAITYESAEVVSLDRFFVERFDEDEWSALGLCDKAVIDQSAIWAYGRAFDYRKDALALMAMHIMTKERTEKPAEPSTARTLALWTFQSAWWSPDASGCGEDQKECGGYAKSRPANIPDGPWTNYLITTTYGVTQKTGPENSWKKVASDTAHGAPDGGDPVISDWPVAFNPYIELAATHPVETNCINCHIRAAWPSRLSTNRTHPEWKKSSYLSKSGPSTLHEFDIGDPLFTGLLTLDSMWAISDRAYYEESPEGGGGR